MIKLLLIAQILGPALFSYSAAYWLRRPQDWTGPALIAPLGLALTALTQTLSLRKLRARDSRIPRKELIATQIAGPAGGLIIGVMVYFLLGGRPS